MNVCAWEELHHLRQNIFEEGKSRFVHVVEIRKDTVFTRWCGEMHIRRSELRICSQRRGGMPGHLDLRHDGDISLLCIGHEAANLFLSVVAAISSGRACDGWQFTPGADLRQLGVLLD